MEKFAETWKILRIYLFLSLLLTLCHGAPNDLQLLNKKIIFFNGKYRSPMDLLFDNKDPPSDTANYLQKQIPKWLKDNLTPTFHSYTMSDDFSSKCAGGKYINRPFSLRQEQMNSETINDGATTIANIIATKITEVNQPSPHIIIMGYMGTGKSVALDKIQFELLQRLPTVWTVRLKLRELFTNFRCIKLINIHEVINRLVAPELQDLFYCLMKINPKKIIFLIDDFDYAALSLPFSMINVINYLQNNGVSFVLTVGQDIDMIQSIATAIVYEIPEMTVPILQQYMMNIWRKTLLATDATISTEHSSVLNELAKVISTTLMDINFPRHADIINHFADHFVSILSFEMINTVDGLGDLLKQLSFRNIHDIIYDIKIDIHTFIESYLEHLGYSDKTYLDIYGPSAFVNVIKDMRMPLRLEIENDKLFHVIATALSHSSLRNRIIEYKYCPLIRSTFNTRFIHQRYEQYYAARYLINLINNHGISTMIQTLLSDSSMKFILEFINFQTQHLYPYSFVRICENQKKLTSILDNFSKYGFENLYLMIVSFTTSQALTQYYQTQIPIFGLPQRSLGLLTDNVCKDGYTKLVVLVKHNMARALAILHKSGIQLSSNENYERILRIVVQQRRRNLELFEIVERMIPDNADIDFDNFMFHMIESEGARCRPIADLMFRAGANPHILKDGRSFLHIAVKHVDREFLRYLIEDIGVRPVDRISDFGSTVFTAALNAKPALYSNNDWWDMMEYLVTTIDPLLLPKQEAINARSDVTTTASNLLNLLNQLYQYGAEISRLEIMTYFRGTDQLSHSDRMRYRNTIVLLLDREQESLTPAVRYRIAQKFLDDMRSIADTEDVKYFVQRGLLIGLDESIAVIFHTKIQSFIMNIYKTNSQQTIGVTDHNTNNNILDCLLYRHTRSTIHNTDCHISWDDIDLFNDGIDRRSIHQIQVNSDKFLQTLATPKYIDTIKEQQLISLLQQLTERLPTSGIIMGNSRMLLRDVMREGGWTAYRQQQRLNNMINNLRHSPSNKKPALVSLPSRSIALYAVASLPLIRGIHTTIDVCMQQSDSNNCLHASSVLAFTATIPAANYVAAKYTHWVINKFSQTALDLLPSAVPFVIRDNVKLMRSFGLKYGARSVATGLTVVGMGVDVYNIVEISMALDRCSRQAIGCPQKDEIDYIISLTFSCISIVVMGGMMISGVGFVPGLIIGLSLMMMEIITLGINEIVFYSNTYHTNFNENFRIFFYQLFMGRPPNDIQALKQRTDVINSLEKHVIYLLDMYGDNVVAYGIGIGRTENGEIKADRSSINMVRVAVKNTKNLSRVLPSINDDFNLLCLPKRDRTVSYENVANTRPSSVYRCHNAFVIAHKRRWNNRNSDAQIIFNLEYVDVGEIFGSNIINNVFIIHNGTNHMMISGGTGFIINTYLLQSHLFRGTILLSKNNRRNILDLSLIQRSIHFSWFHNSERGSIQFGNKHTSKMTLIALDGSPQLYIIGRAAEPDVFNCEYMKYYDDSLNASIIIDGRGGNVDFMDDITDCGTSIVHPYTRIVGSNYSDVTYIAYLSLDKANTSYTTNATIVPRESSFTLIFRERPLFDRVYSLEYSPDNNTLVWKLLIEPSIFLLSIESYRKVQLNDISSVNCVFVDSYMNITVFPVLNSSKHDTSSTIVEQFNVFGTVNSLILTDVFNRYHEFIAFMVNRKWNLLVKFSHSETGRAYVFGSKLNDKFYIDANITFVFGGDGSDVYVVNRNTPNCVLINNEANDNEWDILVVPDSICSSLIVKRGSSHSACCNASQHDVTLTCLTHATIGATQVTAVLHNYLLDLEHQHLQIHWQNATYMLLPDDWLVVQNDNDRQSVIALLFSFGAEWHEAILTLTKSDSPLILNVTDEFNSFVVYKSNNDVVLSKKYLDYSTSSFVVLQEFYTNGTNNINIQWHNLTIFIVNNITDDTIPKILHVEDVNSLVMETKSDNNRHVGNDLIQEYNVNITRSQNTQIIIEHNQNTSFHGDKLGVLTIIGAEPGEFYANFDDNGTYIILHAHGTCIHLKNWCRSIRHRIDRIEFIRSMKQPVVMSNLNALYCQMKDRAAVLNQLNQKFINAQQQMQLIDEYSDNDISRLLHCVGCIFVQSVTHKFMNRLFDFSSVIEQVRFMRENCNALRENLDMVTLEEMKNMLHNAIMKFELSDVTQDDKESIAIIRSSVDQLDVRGWNNFKSILKSNIEQKNY